MPSLSWVLQTIPLCLQRLERDNKTKHSVQFSHCLKFLGLITWIYYRAIWFNSNWQHFQPCYLSLYFSLVRHAYETFISHTDFSHWNISVQFFPQRQAFSLFQTWGFPLNPIAMGRGCQRFQYCIPGCLSREKRRWGTILVSLTQDSEILFSSSWLDPFPEPCSDSSYGNGRQSLWRRHRGNGRHGSTSSCLEWWGLCSAEAGDLVGSSAWKVQLKEATPVLSKRERNSTLPLGSQNSRDNRGTIPWTMAHRPCLETAVCERGEICLQICWVTEAGRGNLGGIRNTTKCRKRG